MSRRGLPKGDSGWLKMLSQVLRRAAHFIDAASSVAVRVAAVAALVAVIMIVAEVAIRYGQLGKVTFADEMSGYAFGFICFLTAADTMREGTFLRVTFISKYFSPRIQNVLMILSYIIGLVVIGLLTFQFGGYFKQTVEIGATSYSVLRTPLWIPQVFVLIGAGLLWLQLLLSTIRGIFTLITNREFGSSNSE